MIRDKLRTHLVSLKSGTRGIIKNRPKTEVQILIPSKPPQAEFFWGSEDQKNYFKESLVCENNGAVGIIITNN